MSIKLVAIDIDGTLLNEKREVTKEVKKRLPLLLQKVFRSFYALAVPYQVSRNS